MCAEEAKESHLLVRYYSSSLLRLLNSPPFYVLTANSHFPSFLTPLLLSIFHYQLVYLPLPPHRFMFSEPTDLICLTRIAYCKISLQQMVPCLDWALSLSNTFSLYFSSLNQSSGGASVVSLSVTDPTVSQC